jgi:hypothetical protein
VSISSTNASTSTTSTTSIESKTIASNTFAIDNEEFEKMYEEKQTRSFTVNDIPKPLQAIPKSELKVSTDYDRFLNECCIVEDGALCWTVELKLAYKQWSKTTDKENVNKLMQYFNSKFKRGIEYLETMKRSVFRGVKLVPCKFEPDDPNQITEYEQFIMDKCESNYMYRISYVDFFQKFVEWKRIQDASFQLTHQYKAHIKEYLESHFACGRVFLSDAASSTHLYGVYSIGIKSEKSNFGLKPFVGRKKKVYKYNEVSGELIQTFDSILDCRTKENVAHSTLLDYIKFNRSKNGFIYRFQ